MGCIITRLLDQRYKERRTKRESTRTSVNLRFSKSISNYEFEPEFDKKLEELLKSKTLKEDCVKSLLKELQSRVYPYSLNPIRYFLTFMSFLIIVTSMVFALIYEDIIENNVPETQDLVNFGIGSATLSYLSHLILLFVFTLMKNNMILRKVNKVKKVIYDYNLKIFHPIGYNVEVSEFGTFLNIQKIVGDFVLVNDFDVKILDKEIFKIKKVCDIENLDAKRSDDSTCDDDEVVEVENNDTEEREEAEVGNHSMRLDSSVSENDSNWVPQSTERCMITREDEK